MGIEQNNYRVSVPGVPLMTVEFISQKHAMEAVNRYQDMGYDVIVENLTLSSGFGNGFYEDWANE